ncbi:maleylacetoacetate isomerase [Aureimonas fodinaquatilis]|uniref:Maleylacetoacetate isomerase n=1 Tax=Aureimonas fodinaquatilis TaxID=2565783 RepID=A0A5B0E0L4_9HYPH|nr:maleylacetoacetate isomerase [Aureimonas fodinaquatilis]KAA0971832.1 maleylacetoacetate isomerase [Aureimonas fodinaquatilis]
MSEIRLHSYFRSSTSVRVRVALAMKGLDYDYVAWNLRAAEQRSSDFLAINPQGLVPALEVDGLILRQSLPIIEYLDERFPQPALLPSDSAGRARVRALAAMIACEVHPLNNLRVLRYLQSTFAADTEAQAAWFCHWTRATLDPLESIVASAPETGVFCHGDQPGLADICVFAQFLNNRRFGLADSEWPVLARIHAACMEIAAFRAAEPDMQPDAK